MTRLRFLARRLVLISLLSVATGCGKPTESQRDNRRLFDAILTAVTTKNAKELVADERLLKERHDNQLLNDASYELLTAIIVKAKAGAWLEAEGDLYRIREKTPFPR